MRVVCHPTESTFHNHYQNQRGNGISIFRGNQRGRGIFGSLIGGLLRSAVPVLKSVARGALKHVARAGINVASDFVGGQNLRDSVKSRSQQQVREVINNLKKRKREPKSVSSKHLKRNNKRIRSTDVY